MKIGQGLGRQLALLRGVGSAFTQHRHQLAGPLAQLLALQIVVEHQVALLGNPVRRGARSIQETCKAPGIPQTNHARE